MKAVQRLVLGDDAAVLVAAVDDLGQVADDIADVAIGDDHQLIQTCKEPAVGVYLATQVVGPLSPRDIPPARHAHPPGRSRMCRAGSGRDRRGG